MRPAGSFCENEEEARIAQISNFTKTQHRRLAARLRQLDRGAAYAAAVVAEDGGLFQFQEAAAEWLRERFQPSRDTGSSRGYSLLEMEPGCGKTRALGSFLQRAAPPGSRILYLTQGGLVRQTRDELCRVVAALPCYKAESTAEFKKHWQAATPAAAPGGLFVVNVALTRTWPAALSECWCVVLDEAHRASAALLRGLASRIPCSSLICVSGTPATGALATLAACASDSQHFVFLKSEAIVRKLAMPRVVLRGMPIASAPSGAAEAVIARLKQTAQSMTAPLLWSLLLVRDAPGPDAPGHDARDHGPWAVALRAWHDTLAWYSPSTRVQLSRRLQHPAILPLAQLLLEKLKLDGEDSSAAPAAADLSSLLQPPVSEAPRTRRPTCACCGLQAEEIAGLHAAIDHSIGVAHLPLPGAWDFGSSAFVRAVLRLPWAAQVTDYKQKVAEARRTETKPGPVCYFLSSDLSAAQRACRVRAFARAQESPAALQMLARRGCFGPPGSAGERVGSIGSGHLVAEILSMVADRAILVCDARSVDCGWNLQLATHVLCPVLPRTAGDLAQLSGRAERILPRGGRSRPEVCLLCLPRHNTGESSLLYHLQRSLAPENENP